MITSGHKFQARSLSALDDNEGCAACGRPRSVHVTAPGTCQCRDCDGCQLSSFPSSDCPMRATAEDLLCDTCRRDPLHCHASMRMKYIQEQETWRT